MLPVSGIAPVIRFASSPRTLAITRWGEFEPPKMAPPNLENRAESPPLAPSEEATVLLYGKSIERAQIFPSSIQKLADFQNFSFFFALLEIFTNFFSFQFLLILFYQKRKKSLSLLLIVALISSEFVCSGSWMMNELIFGIRFMFRSPSCLMMFVVYMRITVTQRQIMQSLKFCIWYFITW